MLNRTIILIAASFVILLNACKNNDNTVSTSAEKKTSESEASGPNIPGIPGDLMSKLLNECTGIDYVFHNMPFSLNQEEKPSIISNIGFIDINKPVGIIPKDCKPIGRKFFKINSNLTYDADVYLNGKCKFYVFVGKDNKPLYANYMTEDAVKFYAQTAAQARQTIQ